ncbi:MAG: PfkB family carbohydrate kinase [candidate division KSB1 bacterium]|nr:PfkB family carbohydrate kinase [candidate division KSB1 bacterium]
MTVKDEKYFDCVGVGICALDHLALLPHFPTADEKLDLIAFSVQGGGPVPTALATMARFGAKVSYIGKVGSDTYGRQVLAELEQFGVDVSGVVIDPHSRTARSYIWVDSQTAKRTVVLDRSSTRNLQPEEVRRDLVQEARFLLTDARESEACLRAVELAKEAGANIVLDLGSVRERSETFLELAQFPVVSDVFVRKFYGAISAEEAVRRLLGYGAEAAVVTLGPEGACFAERNSAIYHLPAFRVKAVDTTGAGDVFHGAFVYALAMGEGLASAVRFASAAAALKCRQLGGRLGIPALREVQELLEQQKDVAPSRLT